MLSQAPKITDHLCEECAAHFAAARGYLDARDVPYRLDHTLVRGLDYYTRTAWEFVSGELGAQATIGGGGRYDGLAEELGGPPTPGIGFGSGVERVAEVAGEPPAPDRGVDGVRDSRRPRRLPRLHALMDEARERGRALRGGVRRPQPAPDPRVGVQARRRTGRDRGRGRVVARRGRRA